MRATTRFVMGALLTVFAAAPCLAEDLAQVEAKIKTMTTKVKSMRAKLRAEMRQTSGQVTQSSNGDGTLEFLRKGDKVLARSELHHVLTRTVGENVTTSEHVVLAVTDGEFTWHENDAADQTSVFKTLPDPQFTAEPLAVLAELRKKNVLTLMSDAKIDGKDTWVIEASPSEVKPGVPVSRTRLYFSKESGFILRWEMNGEGAKPVTWLEYREMQFDVPLPEERFVYTAPPGAPVYDDTKPRAERPKPDQVPDEAPTSAPTTAPTTRPAKP